MNSKISIINLSKWNEILENVEKSGADLRGLRWRGAHRGKWNRLK